MALTELRIVPEIPPIPNLDLTAIYKNHKEDVVCRTCAFSDTRDWPASTLSPEEYALADLDVLRCEHDKILTSYKIVDEVDGQRNFPLTAENNGHKTLTTVDSCGHKVLPKCTRCERFEANIVQIPYAGPNDEIRWRIVDKGYDRIREPYTVSGAPVRWWKVAVGGYCTIPAEGIEIAGKTTYCDPIDRRVKVENPSCANCYYNYTTGTNWQQDHQEVNANAALTPYEREQAILKGRQRRQGVAQSLGIALWEKQRNSIGRRMWYRAELIETHPGNPTKYLVRFTDTYVEAIIAAGDDRFNIYECDNNILAIEIAWPWHKLFRLNDRLRTYFHDWPELPGESKLVKNYTVTNRVNADCAKLNHDMGCNIERQIPCYYHAKNPVVDPLTREINFDDPAGQALTRRISRSRTLKVIRRNGQITAVDGNGNIPVTYSQDIANISVYRLWYPTLVATAHRRYGHEGVRAIEKQYYDLRAGMRRQSKMRTLRPSWLVPSGQEPNKPVCSHPEGLDFRKVFQDAFGSERAERDYDTGPATIMAVEEELRTGYRQHNLTPQKLQEENLTTITSHPLYDGKLGDIRHPDPTPMPNNPTIVKIEGIGGMTREDGTPVTNTREFLDRLDEEIEIGTEGETTRHITRRRQLFGYDLSRGFYGNRRGQEKTNVPSTDPDYIIFAGTDENTETDDDNWHCLDCNNTYTQAEIADFFNPVCECGADLYRTQNTRSTYNTRAAGGIGNALHPVSEAMLERARLEASLCPNWKLRTNGTPNIGLENLAGPELKNTQPRLVNIAALTAESDNKVKIVKVGTLTQAQKTSNAKYQAKLDLVLAERANWLDNNPEGSADDAIKRYPTPGGTYYQEKAVGSAAKMGTAAGVVD